jgi:DNA-binding SARP family transcriptional activator
MEFRVLGTLEVWCDGQRLPLAAAKQRAFLATGLLSAGHVVATPRLIDAIWGEAPPTTAPMLIHTYASRLRHLLHRPGRRPVILTVPPGYRVDLGGHRLDLDEFRVLVARGRTAAAAGDQDAAAAHFRRALALWRGPALDGVTTPVLRNHAARLEEARLTVLEERVSADLAVNPLEPLVEELTGLVAEHPLREHLRASLMLVLYRLGRSAQALTCYHHGRVVLRETLGVDPAPELQALHRSILAGAPGLDRRRYGGSSRGTPCSWCSTAPALGGGGTG